MQQPLTGPYSSTPAPPAMSRFASSAGAGGSDGPLRGGVATPRPRPTPPRPQRHPRPTGRPPRPLHRCHTARSSDRTPRTHPTTDRRRRRALPPGATRSTNSTALHRHDMRQLLTHTVDHVAALRRQVESLDVWGRWAGGDTVNVQRLGDIVEQLTNISRRNEQADQFEALGQTVPPGRRAGIDLPPPHGTAEPSDEPAPNWTMTTADGPLVVPSPSTGNGSRSPGRIDARVDGHRTGPHRSPREAELGRGGIRVRSISPNSALRPNQPSDEVSAANLNSSSDVLSLHSASS